MSVLPVCMYVHNVHACSPWRSEEGTDIRIVVSYHMGSRLYERIISALNCRAIFSNPYLFIFNYVYTHVAAYGHVCT